MKCIRPSCERPAAFVMVLRCCDTRRVEMCMGDYLRLRTHIVGHGFRRFLCRFCRITPEITFEDRLTPAEYG